MKLGNTDNGSIKSVQLKGAAAAVSLLAASFVTGQAMATDYDMAAMNDEIMLLLAQLDQAATPMWVSATSTTDGDALRSRIVGLEGRLSVLGESAPGFSAAMSDGDRYSTWDLWIKANTAYQTVLKRCEYIRDHAGPAAGRPSLTAISTRLQQMEIASQLVAAPAQPTGRVNLGLVADLMAATDEMIAILQDRQYDLSDPDSSDYRFSTYELHLAVGDIYERAGDACPAD